MKSKRAPFSSLARAGRTSMALAATIDMTCTCLPAIFSSLENTPCVDSAFSALPSFALTATLETLGVCLLLLVTRRHETRSKESEDAMAAILPDLHAIPLATPPLPAARDLAGEISEACYPLLKTWNLVWAW